MLELPENIRLTNEDTIKHRKRGSNYSWNSIIQKIYFKGTNWMMLHSTRATTQENMGETETRESINNVAEKLF